MSIIISVRIPKKLKEKAKKYGINISKVVREALKREIERRELENIKRLQSEAKAIMSKIKNEDVVKAIREIRNER